MIFAIFDKNETALVRNIQPPATATHILKANQMTDDLNSDTPHARALTEALDILRNAGLDANLDLVNLNNVRIDISLNRQAPVPYDSLLTSCRHALEADGQAHVRFIAIGEAQQRR